MFFGLFNKKKAQQITEEGRKVIKEVSESFDAYCVSQKNIITPPSVTPQLSTPKPKKKSNKKQFVSFTSWMGDNTFSGVIVKTNTYTKKKSEVIGNVYVVTVLKENGKPVRPYLKWINEEYCTMIPSYTTKYDSKYFNYEWMENNAKEKTKRKQIDKH